MPDERKTNPKGPVPENVSAEVHAERVRHAKKIIAGVLHDFDVIPVPNDRYGENQPDPTAPFEPSHTPENLENKD